MRLRKDDAMLFGLVIGALAFLRRRVDWGSGWVWPVPTMRLNGITYQPVISDGPGSPRSNGTIHRGVDIMYRRRSATDVPQYANGSASGSPWHFAPERTPVLAAKDGKLWSAGLTPRGWSVVIDHGKPFATYYTHMDALNVPAAAGGKARASGKPVAVKAGDVIGWMGGDPLDGRREHLRHLHFAVWHNGTDENAVDPSDAMKLWPRAAMTWSP